jgi:hypothetical protein
MFGRETIERAGPIWGLDDEGELRGVYRPSGHPGVRFWLCGLLDQADWHAAVVCGR